MTETRYPAVRRYVSETPSTLLLLREVISRRIAGERLDVEELAEITAAAPKRSAVSPTDGGSIAVLPLWGIIAPHQVNDLSSGPTTALDSWGALFDELVNDPKVGTIVLDVDSPGGSVDLVPETAAKIRAANARKEIVAVANTRIGSAAYWLASQAGQLVVSPSGAVGSIGVYAAHEDVSEQLAAEGVNVTLISAGAHKVDGNPFEPLSDDARATIQANVDAYYGMFVGDVAKGRGVEPSVVEKKFGQGRMVLAGDAVKAGMADRVATLEDTLARLLKGQPATKRARADDLEPELAALEVIPGVRDGERIVVELVGDSSGAMRQLLGAGAFERSVLAGAAARELAEAPAPRILERKGTPDNDSGSASAGTAASGGDSNRTKEKKTMRLIAELVSRREEITARLTELDQAQAEGLLDDAEAEEFDTLHAEAQEIDAQLAKREERREQLAALTDRKPETKVRATPKPDRGGIASNVDRKGPEDVHDLAAYSKHVDSLEELVSLQVEGARRITETVRLVGSSDYKVDRDRSRERLEDVLETDVTGELARRVILCGDPAYDRAFGKMVMRGRDALSTKEDGLIRAAVTESGLGSETPVPITIDPTVALTSAGATNPIRALAREVTIAGLTWRGITSGGMTMAYENAETNQVADQTPSLGGDDISVIRADGYVAFSIEVDMDWGALRGELAREFADGKNVLEAQKFLTGSGSGEPLGIITALTAATAQVVKTAATATFAIDDPDLISNALAPRFDADASWLASKAVWAKVESLSRAAGNADPFSFAVEGIPAPIDGRVNRIFRGYPMYNASGMDTAFSTSGKNIMVLGDFGRGMVIVDRIGLNVELIPLVLGANQRPVGQRALYTYFRNNTGVPVPQAFELLQVK
jgi:HK97 family phage major capsid protein